VIEQDMDRVEILITICLVCLFVFSSIHNLGLAGIQSGVSDIFLQHKIKGISLGLLLRDDLHRMGITKLDQQLIIMQSIDLLLTLVRAHGVRVRLSINISFCLVCLFVLNFYLGRSFEQ
jgi:hypothetical protein